MLWAYRREPKKALLLCLGTAIPMGWAYVFWQPTAFFQALRNGGYVSVGFVGRALLHAVRAVHDPARTPRSSSASSPTPGCSSSAGCCRGSSPGWRRRAWGKGRRVRRDPLTIALRTSLVLSVAWLVTSMYTLSWYDLIAWMPLAVIGPSKLDRLMTVRGCRAVAGLRPRPRDRRRTVARRRRAPDPRHVVPDRADPGADRARPVVEEAAAHGVLPVPLAEDRRRLRASRG